MEDYVDYVNRQFDILLQHLATGWGQQIKAELATITNNNTLSELQKNSDLCSLQNTMC